MDSSKNYIGKILKVHFQYNNKECAHTGIVYDQEKTSHGPRFSMLLTNGQECTMPPPGVPITKVTSARIDPSLREALTDFCKAKRAQQAFLKNFWNEKSAHEKNVSNALRSVRDRSGTLSHSEFCHAVEALFADKFPTSNNFHRCLSLACTSTSADSFTMSHIQEIEKYALPEKYPFIYREYDNNLFIDDTVKGYKAFCEKNAPGIVGFLKDKKVKISTNASLGDKNFLCVSRDYTFPLKYGLTKKSLEYIKENFIDSPEKKKSLADQMKSASSRTSRAQGAKTKNPNKSDPER